MTDTEGWKGRRAAPPGELSALVSRLDDLGRRLGALETATPLQSAAISSGGLTVKDGGSVTVEGGGGLAINTGGDVAVNDGGDVAVNNGGDVTVNDGGNVLVNDGGDLVIDGGDVRVTGAGGSLVAEHPDGSTAAMFGPLWPDGSPGTIDARGLLVQSTSADSNKDIFRAKRVLSDGTKVVYVGQSGAAGAIHDFGVWADQAWIDVITDLALSVSGTTKLYIASDGVRITGPNTASAANVNIDTGTGLLRVSTSSLRYKANVEDLDVTVAQVLGMRPVTFQDAGEIEVDPTTTKRYPGFIAEEIADLGLEVLVVRDDEGRPNSLHHDRFPAAQQIVLRDHEARIVALQEQNTAQADLITDLTARLDTLEAS